ncbi:MAG: hypothetical protein AAFN09_04620 [Pseudomonadota bacterium]
MSDQQSKSVHSASDVQSGRAENGPQRAKRLAHLQQVGRNHGFFRRVGQEHSALFVDEGDELIVTFDSAERVLDKTADGLPLGFTALKRRECSLLSIMGRRGSFFRETALYALFDYLVDDGFFDRFERVAFVGLGPMCGYGAAAYSVAAPGARVLAVNPVATLDRDAAPFERRYRAAWGRDFTSRYGFAPQMTDGAEQVTIIYDPADAMCAAHAALFQGHNVARHKLRWGGMSSGKILSTGNALEDVIDAAFEGRLTAPELARLLRPARRGSPAHLARLMTRAAQSGHPKLALEAARRGKTLTTDGRFDGAVAILRAHRDARAVTS